MFDAQPVARQLFGTVWPHHERDVTPGAHEVRAEISAQRAGSDHQDTHFAHAPRFAVLVRARPYFDLVLPSLSYCETKAQRLLISFSLLMPANAILVPGILAFGSLMYSLNWASFQVMPEFLLASV